MRRQRATNIPRSVRLYMYLFGFCLAGLVYSGVLLLLVTLGEVGAYAYIFFALGSWLLFAVLAFLKREVLREWGLLEETKTK